MWNKGFIKINLHQDYDIFINPKLFSTSEQNVSQNDYNYYHKSHYIIQIKFMHYPKKVIKELRVIFYLILYKI